jgi:hypothetical protein
VLQDGEIGLFSICIGFVTFCVPRSVVEGRVNVRGSPWEHESVQAGELVGELGFGQVQRDRDRSASTSFDGLKIVPKLGCDARGLLKRGAPRDPYAGRRILRWRGGGHGIQNRSTCPMQAAT